MSSIVRAGISNLPVGREAIGSHSSKSADASSMKASRSSRYMYRIEVTKTSYGLSEEWSLRQENEPL